MWDIGYSMSNLDNLPQEVPADFKIEVPGFTDDEEEKVENPFIYPKNDWKDFFEQESNKDYFKEIIQKYQEMVDKAELVNTKIYPKKEEIFRAFELCSIKKLKVIIIGQDPYPGECSKTKIPYANGLAFSVKNECTIPASLKNMYDELENSGYKKPENGNLEKWAEQGVFLLNTQLSVTKGVTNSHKFWKEFTDNVIKYLCNKKDKMIFVLMGGNAIDKMKVIENQNKFKFIITSHPSPLGYKKTSKGYPPFYDSKIFKKINKELQLNVRKTIKW